MLWLTKTEVCVLNNITINLDMARQNKACDYHFDKEWFVGPEQANPAYNKAPTYATLLCVIQMHMTSIFPDKSENQTCETG